MSYEPKCPHCGVKLEDELFYDLEDGESQEMVCDNCNEEFWVRVTRSVCYDVQKSHANCMAKVKAEEK